MAKADLKKPFHRTYVPPPSRTGLFRIMFNLFPLTAADVHPAQRDFISWFIKVGWIAIISSLLKQMPKRKRKPSTELCPVPESNGCAPCTAGLGGVCEFAFNRTRKWGNSGKKMCMSRPRVEQGSSAFRIWEELSRADVRPAPRDFVVLFL
jgi:hypothetical protein